MGERESRKIVCINIGISLFLSGVTLVSVLADSADIVYAVGMITLTPLDTNIGFRELTVTPQKARQIVRAYFMDHVSLFIGPIYDPPALIIAHAADIVWRVQLSFSWGTQGHLGIVGTVDVDALTGTLRISEELIAQITENASQLSNASTSTTTK